MKTPPKNALKRLAQVCGILTILLLIMLNLAALHGKAERFKALKNSVFDELHRYTDHHVEGSEAFEDLRARLPGLQIDEWPIVYEFELLPKAATMNPVPGDRKLVPIACYKFLDCKPGWMGLLILPYFKRDVVLFENSAVLFLTREELRRRVVSQ